MVSTSGWVLPRLDAYRLNDQAEPVSGQDQFKAIKMNADTVEFSTFEGRFHFFNGVFDLSRSKGQIMHSNRKIPIHQYKLNLFITAAICSTAGFAVGYIAALITKTPF